MKGNLSLCLNDIVGEYSTQELEALDDKLAWLDF